MHYKAAVLALAGAAVAQSDSPSICSKYTTALFMDDTPANQLMLLTKVVNTAVIGNYTAGAMNAVPGILKAGTYMGTQVSLAGYFDGSMATTNRGGMPTMVNFLDGGGAAPLMNDMPANDMSSNQGRLLTHLYSYFGLLLGCTGVGMGDYPAYGGSNSQYSVHQYMNLSNAEFGYFVQQVALSAKSFGVTQDDLTTAGNALMQTFGYRCLPAAAVGGGEAQLQSICTGDQCPTAPNAQCAAYQMAAGSGSSSMSMSSMSMMPSGTSSAVPMETTGAASHHHVAMEGMLGAACAALAFL